MCVCVCVLVWMSECGLYVCHKKNCVCVLVIFERDKLCTLYKHCVQQRCFAASNGENVVLRPNKILLKAHFLRYQPQIWNTTSLEYMSLIF